MHRNIPVFFAIVLLGILILCSACVLSGDKQPVVNVGLSQITTREIPARISFEEATQKFSDYHRISRSAENLPVYYILTRDVDRSGNASNWLFGVRQKTGPELWTYDRTGWKTIPWNATLPQEEIIIDQIIPPETLFIRYENILYNTSLPQVPVYRDLSLRDGRYTLVIKSGSTSRSYVFNATTGALITGNV